MFFRINGETSDVCVKCPHSSRFSMRAFYNYSSGATSGPDKLASFSRCWWEIRVAPLNTLSFLGSPNLRSYDEEKETFFRRKIWQAYLETIKGAIILHGKNVV